MTKWYIAIVDCMIAGDRVSRGATACKRLSADQKPICELQGASSGSVKSL
ncbi:hypothetical protein WH297_16285 [Ochrobactrum vermis]|uniref:Uncharacterized protein n=1 Tax=Ochrobactrum vermis TaxID=1827297 RepID=A0ABU8PI76_9HYPH